MKLQRNRTVSTCLSLEISARLKVKW